MRPGRLATSYSTLLLAYFWPLGLLAFRPSGLRDAKTGATPVQASYALDPDDVSVPRGANLAGSNEGCQASNPPIPYLADGPERPSSLDRDAEPLERVTLFRRVFPTARGYPS